jgi:hypothetical protein
MAILGSWYLQASATVAGQGEAHATNVCLDSDTEADHQATFTEDRAGAPSALVRLQQSMQRNNALMASMHHMLQSALHTSQTHEVRSESPAASECRTGEYCKTATAAPLRTGGVPRPHVEVTGANIGSYNAGARSSSHIMAGRQDSADTDCGTATTSTERDRLRQTGEVLHTYQEADSTNRLPHRDCNTSETAGKAQCLHLAAAGLPNGLASKADRLASPRDSSLGSRTHSAMSRSSTCVPNTVLPETAVRSPSSESAQALPEVPADAVSTTRRMAVQAALRQRKARAAAWRHQLDVSSALRASEIRCAVSLLLASV